MKKFPFAPKKTYDEFAKYFPFATADVVIFYQDSFLLTKRDISPYKGLWHLPGGIIRKGEKIENAAKRVLKKELNLNVKFEKFLGVYENPIRTRHDIAHCFVAKIVGKVRDDDLQIAHAKFFKKIPSNTISYQKIIIRDAINLLREH